jgi:hypothetical protein
VSETEHDLSDLFRKTADLLPRYEALHQGYFPGIAGTLLQVLRLRKRKSRAELLVELWDVDGQTRPVAEALASGLQALARDRGGLPRELHAPLNETLATANCVIAMKAYIDLLEGESGFPQGERWQNLRRYYGEYAARRRELRVHGRIARKVFLDMVQHPDRAT